MRTKKAVTSFDFLYKEAFAQQISKAASNMPEISVDEFHYVRVVADRLTSIIEQMAKIDHLSMGFFAKTDSENPATI